MDYEQKAKRYTTFGMDFSIADMFGLEAIKDTYTRSLDFALSDAKYFAEFILILNHKIWQWYQKSEKIARLYDQLWRKAYGMADSEHFTKEELSYIYEYLD